MKKLLLITTLMSSILLLGACSEELLPQETIIPNSDVELLDESLTSEEWAINALENFIEVINENGKRGKPVTYSNLGISIEGINKTTTATYASGNDSSTTYGDVTNVGLPIFEFTLKNADGTNGFAVVTAEKCSNDVIAYAEVGSISDTTFNEGLAMYFKELAHLTQFYEEELIEELVIDESNPATYLHIGTENEYIYPDIPVQGYLFVDDYTVQSYFLRWLTPAEVTERNKSDYSLVRYSSMWTKYVKRIVTPKWHQRNPYNARIPYTYRNPKTGKSEYHSVGCFNLAMGMVALNLQYPYSYNWGVIPKSSPIYSWNTTAASEVSRLLCNFFILSKTEPLGLGGGNTPRWKHPEAMSSLGFKYNITEVDRGPIPASTLIKTDLEQNLLPLLLANTVLPNGSHTGHIWIVDGYMEMARHKDVSAFHMGGSDHGKHSFTRYQQKALLLHHNWGWGGDSDGWYYNLQPYRKRGGEQLNFYYYRTIYSQIKPK